MTRRMQIRLLGHLEASVDDRPLELGGSKQRAVLAMLGLEANQMVSADRLVEGLWGEEPPASAAKMVQNYILRLRKVIAADGAAEIVTRGRAYELQIDRELIDALRFERLVAEATRGGSGDAARQALALYRGEPLADIASEPFAGAEIRRLEELRLTASELAVDADLAAGRHQELLERDRRAAGREPAARAPARAADARAVPLRAPGRRARGLSGGARDAGRRRSASSRARSCSACRPRSCARTRRSPSRRPRPNSRPSSRPRPRSR